MRVSTKELCYSADLTVSRKAEMMAEMTAENSLVGPMVGPMVYLTMVGPMVGPMVYLTTAEMTVLLFVPTMKLQAWTT